MGFDHLDDLQLEVCVKYSSGFRVAHGLCHFGFNNLSGCLFLLDHYIPLFLAVSIVALVRKSPQLSARLKGRFMQDPKSYEAVFTEHLPIVVWPKLVTLMKLVDLVISGKVPPQKVGPRIVAGWRGATALCAVAEIFTSFENSVQDLVDLDEKLLVPKRIAKIFEFLTKPRANGRPNIGRLDKQRAHVELRCEEFGATYAVSGTAVIGRWHLPNSIEDSLSKSIDERKKGCC